MDYDDEEQYRRFVTARMGGLRRLAYLSCGNWATAEDAVATALSKLYVRWGSVANRDAYARTMVVRAAIDETRRPWWQREREASHALPEPEFPDHGSAVAERLDMTAALLEVPARQRSVLILRYYEQLDTQQTAAALGCRESTVRSQTVRGLAALGRALRARGHDLTNEHMEADNGVPGPRRTEPSRLPRAGAQARR